MSTGKQRYFFSEFTEIDNFVRASTGMLGLAFPLKGGELLVQRFNLKGAVEALDAMRAGAVKKRDKTKPATSTKDLKL